MNAEGLRVHGQPFQKLLGGDVVLVVPKRTTTERQWVAFKATEQEPSTGERTHVVGAEHHLVRDSTVGDGEAGDAAEARVIVVNEAGKRAFVTAAERFNDATVVMDRLLLRP
jgi:hypothetical protein